MAGEIRRYREERGMSAQQLADRCKQLGMEIPRPVLANLENGRRATVTAAELLVLAEALQVPPLLLVIPLARRELIEILPGMDVSAFEAARWWRGEGDWIEDLGDGPVAVSDLRRKTPVERVFEHQDLVARWIATQSEVENATIVARQAAANDRERWTLTVETHRKNLGNFAKRLIALRREMRDEKLIPPSLPPELAHLDTPVASPARTIPAMSADAGSTRRQEQPVVAAIVTSARGILVGRRNDGTPPWTFIAGEVESGERPEDAAVREVKEETGLEINPGQVIGARDHPATGRHMIYLAAKPAGRTTRIAVGDEAELAEVRWVSLSEADELLPGLYQPVRDYLA